MSCAPAVTASATTSGVIVRQVSSFRTSVAPSPSNRPTLSHSAASRRGANDSRYNATSATVGMTISLGGGGGIGDRLVTLQALQTIFPELHHVQRPTGALVGGKGELAGEHVERRVLLLEFLADLRAGRIGGTFTRLHQHLVSIVDQDGGCVRVALVLLAISLLEQLVWFRVLVRRDCRRRNPPSGNLWLFLQAGQVGLFASEQDIRGERLKYPALHDAERPRPAQRIDAAHCKEQ